MKIEAAVAALTVTAVETIALVVAVATADGDGDGGQNRVATKVSCNEEGVCACVCFWPPVPKWGPVKHEIQISSPPLDDIPSIP